MGLDNPLHIAFLLIMVLLVFGARRLPEMGRSLGDGMRGFRDALGGHGATPAASDLAAQPVAQPVLVPGAHEPDTAAADVASAPPPREHKPAAA